MGGLLGSEPPLIQGQEHLLLPPGGSRRSLQRAKETPDGETEVGSEPVSPGSHPERGRSQQTQPGAPTSTVGAFWLPWLQPGLTWALA